jgi:hypothetical protein
METDGVDAFHSTGAAGPARDAPGTALLDPYSPESRRTDDWPDDRPADTDTEPTGPPPGTSGRRRGRRRLVLVYVVVSMMLVTAVAVGVQANRRLTRTDTSLTATRAQLQRTTAQVATARSKLAAAVAHSEAAEQTLNAESAQLAADQAQLAKAQADVHAKGVSIGQLDLCLSGVEQALNQIAVGDQVGAVTTLNGVSSNCQSAEPSG